MTGKPFAFSVQWLGIASMTGYICTRAMFGNVDQSPSVSLLTLVPKLYVGSSYKANTVLQYYRGILEGVGARLLPFFIYPLDSCIEGSLSASRSVVMLCCNRQD